MKKSGKKLFKKLKAEGIKKLSAVKAVSKISEQTPPLVKEGRMGYFQKEYMEEAKWLS